MSIPKRKFGRSGPEVSSLGFGLMRLPWTGDSHVNIDEARAGALVRRAIEAGLNYFDTAWPYHGPAGTTAKGESEPFLGRCLAREKGLRGRVLIATKLPIMQAADRADMDRILGEQLQRLQTDYIDFYLAHGVHARGWKRMQELGLLDFLEAARKDGRIRWAGFSFHDEFPLFEEIVKAYDWDLAQIQYNYLDRNFQAGEAGLKLAAGRGLAVAVMEPLRGGSLVRDLPAEALAILRRARPDWSPAEWALKWLWQQQEIGLVLSGMSNLEQLEDNLRIAAESRPGLLSPEELGAVDQVAAYFQARTRVGCTACGYCLPCPAGVDIPRNFNFFNRYHLLDSLGPRRQTWHFYQGQMPPAQRAERCTACGQCEERCPQKLPVAELMAEAAALFDPENKSA